MKLNEWKQAVKNSKGVDYDKNYGKQCVDLVNDFANRVLGIKDCFYGLTYAYEIYTRYSSISKINTNFSRINVNAPGEYPKVGDVIVWGKEKNGYAGHTAVCIENGSTDGFKVFEQNYDGKGGIREYTYSGYKNVSGWLRPKNQSNIKEEVKKAAKYGNAYMLSAQNVYCDSLLMTKIGSVSKDEGVYLDGSGSGNDQIVYRCGNYYKTGYVKGGTVKKN